MTVDVPDVQAARAQVERLPTLPVSAHVAVFEEVHRLLDGVLADLDGLATAPPRPADGDGPVRGPDPRGRDAVPPSRAPGLPGPHQQGPGPRPSGLGVPRPQPPGPDAPRPQPPGAGEPRPGGPRPGPPPGAPGRGPA
ncbi:translation initiation/elongation factor [Candidatus Protofrankia datiscae]|uniref:Putative translation initiation/elongation factor n=1 Tax=Candidatus Protofrankia datiscae TaxID=2716812 RepID=F8AZ86_9ACTN|nr:translation initiation/elongation factor [Candidatus Protofrankia datiscae]AEH10561.1 putative translation initiation/elongation factor [Candidatus Protofrankia datiscae]